MAPKSQTSREADFGKIGWHIALLIMFMHIQKNSIGQKWDNLYISSLFLKNKAIYTNHSIYKPIYNGDVV